MLNGPSRVLFGTLLILWAIPAFAAAQVDELKREYRQIEKEIATTSAEHDRLSGGLLKSLMAARLELLKTNVALVKQRIHALQSGAKITITLKGTKPDPGRAARLAKDIRELKSRIASKEAESARYSGGLILAMLKSGIATDQMSLAMLETELLKAKYGIHWLPSLKQDSKNKNQTASKVVQKSRKSRQRASTTAPRSNKATNVLTPTLENKHFQDTDIEKNIYQKAIYFDIKWDTSKLKRPTRAVKGVLVFADLFGEPKFRIRLTIDDPLAPKEKFTQTGIGFRYNQFTSTHKWVRSTDLSNMTFQFEVREILYRDGTTEKF